MRLPLSARLPAALGLLGWCLFSACNGEKPSPAPSAPVFHPVPVTGGPAGLNAATITAGPPLDGLTITVPAGATTEDVMFSVAYANGAPSGVKVPSDVKLTSRLIQISATGSQAWNVTRAFSVPLTVTLPYDDPTLVGVDEATVDFYSVDDAGRLTASGFVATDRVNHTVSFLVGNLASAGLGAATSRLPPGTSALDVTAPYAKFIAAGINLQDQAGLGRALRGSGSLTVDTQFKAAVNGFYVPNDGTYLNPDGSCEGMCLFAVYYFQTFSAPLFRQYRDSEDTSLWVTDAAQIKLTGIAQTMSEYDLYLSEQFSASIAGSQAEVAYAALGALYITGEPFLLEMKLASNYFAPGHATVAYAADITVGGISFHIYDPNYPADDTNRRVKANPNRANVFDTYGPSAFDTFAVVGYGASPGSVGFAALKAAADAGFADDSQFASIGILGCVGYNTNTPCQTMVGPNGAKAFISDDTGVLLTGTVTPGQSGPAVASVTAFSGGSPSYSTVDATTNQFSVFAAVPTTPSMGPIDVIAGDVLPSTRPAYPWSANGWAGMTRAYLSAQAAPPTTGTGGGGGGGGGGSGGAGGAGGSGGDWNPICPLTSAEVGAALGISGVIGPIIDENVGVDVTTGVIRACEFDANGGRVLGATFVMGPTGATPGTAAYDTLLSTLSSVGLTITQIGGLGQEAFAAYQVGSSNPAAIDVAFDDLTNLEIVAPSGSLSAQEQLAQLWFSRL